MSQASGTYKLDVNPNNELYLIGWVDDRRRIVAAIACSLSYWRTIMRESTEIAR